MRARCAPKQSHRKSLRSNALSQHRRRRPRGCTPRNDLSRPRTRRAHRVPRWRAAAESTQRKVPSPLQRAPSRGIPHPGRRRGPARRGRRRGRAAHPRWEIGRRRCRPPTTAGCAAQRGAADRATERRVDDTAAMVLDGLQLASAARRLARSSLGGHRPPGQVPRRPAWRPTGQAQALPTSRERRQRRAAHRRAQPQSPRARSCPSTRTSSRLQAVMLTHLQPRNHAESVVGCSHVMSRIAPSRRH